jgi:dephospho-CoA kinase
MPRMLHVGLTGNIASGKSQAALVFAELGAHIIDADRIVHGLLSGHTATAKSIAESFGETVLNPDGSIDRKKLAAIVFSDPAKRLLLNSIVHPEVRREVFRRIAELEAECPGGGIVIVDAALMVESGGYRYYDRLVVVVCDPALQLARIVSRDGLSIEDAKARMAAQMPVQEKVKVADYTIDTSGTFVETRAQIEAIYQDLLSVQRKLTAHG